MRYRMIALVFFLGFFLLIDLYFFQGVLAATKNLSPAWRTMLRYSFWVPSVLAVVALFWWTFDDPYRFSANVRNWIITGLVAVYFSKSIGVLFLLVDDLHRAIRWTANAFYKGHSNSLPGEVISRSEFISKAALVATAVPFGTMAYGIISGAHDYRVRRVVVKLDNLPKAFDGIRLVHLSDIHSGSFWNKTAVKGGIEMVMAEKPDLIFFTGDLVNNESEEVRDYIDIFNKLHAPLGVFSVTGNHDYGDYKSWNSKLEKQQNFADLIEAHRLLGFNLLMNENRTITIGGEQISIVGNENWGAGRFSKYGQLAKAVEGTQESPVKLLLSHDPSHWDAQIRPSFKDIDITFAGHTHGFQFGVEVGNFKWSPSQYAYKQWAGLYTAGKQHLYVNRGFGYLGYPGRIGMPPEITMMELKRA